MHYAGLTRQSHLCIKEIKDRSDVIHDSCLFRTHRCVFRSLMIVNSAINWFVAGNTSAFSGKVAHVEGRR